MQLITGQRVPLATLNIQQQLDLTFDVAGSAPQYAALCFLLGADSRLISPDATISPSQPTAAGGAVTWQTGQPGQRFSLDLGRLPATVERLAFGLVPEGGDLRGVQRGTVSFGTAGNAAATWTLSGPDFSNEKAIIAAEIYRHQGAWRLMINGQGFSDGLSGLVRHFGGTGLPSLRAAPPPAPIPPPTPPASPPSGGGLDLSRRGRPDAAPAGQPPAPVQPPASGGMSLNRNRGTSPSSTSPSSTPSNAAPSRPISLTKITLEKQGQSARISLQKAGTQRIHVNLNWEAKPSSAAPSGGGGFLSKLLGSVTGADKAADLDLGCMYELASGEKGVIQALGGNFGKADGPPFIKLDQDDRSGASAGGENLYIERPDLIRKVLIFAFIYEGAGNFSEVGGRLSFNDPQGNEIKMSLSNPAALPFCAVALVQAHGNELVITKEERYFSGHRDCDQAFDFGFSWKAGRK
ncbi:tellurium resistance protein TerA [Deinococcus psychrotolerans]|uniref:Tellurium resistance protein TerA n=1 Tax=Deinococcus psychrotolerans TaxID=2489213 RepID=A0A3G8YPT3_9DEIO|nr:TerD family protein [Deinococcus psychrotolerans]AZI43186.1 tellurium resistance protein TerA [Deinococcus psychrotolerans]